MSQVVLSKVPAVTLGFWIIKILATTLGEIAGDTASMSLELGYLLSTTIFVVPLAGLIALQIVSEKFQPVIYWATIAISTTIGTTLADFADRSLGMGYAGGAGLLLLLLLATLAIWYRVEGSISVTTVNKPRVEAFYWLTIIFSQTLGTALGDWLAETPDLGYVGAATVFATLLVILALVYWFTGVSRVLLFWSAFILTRPLGASLGDFLDKPFEEGGMAFSRPIATVLIAAVMIAAIWFFPQRAGSHPSSETA